MRTLSDAWSITRWNALSPRTMATPRSACDLEPSTIPSVITFSPMARSGSDAICPTAVITVNTDRTASARHEMRTIIATVRRALRIGEPRRLQRVHLRVRPAEVHQLYVGAVL